MGGKIIMGANYQSLYYPALVLSILLLIVWYFIDEKDESFLLSIGSVLLLIFSIIVHWQLPSLFLFISTPIYVIKTMLLKGCTSKK